MEKVGSLIERSEATSYMSGLLFVEAEPYKCFQSTMKGILVFSGSNDVVWKERSASIN